MTEPRKRTGSRQTKPVDPLPIDDEQAAATEAKPNGADIPAPDAPSSLGKYARFIASDETVATGQAKTFTCMVGPPPKTSYIRTHPDGGMRLSLHTFVHEVGTKKKHYLIDPALQTDDDLEGQVRIKMFVPYITHHRPPKLGLWPIAIQQEANPWVKGALRIVDEAAHGWLKVVAVAERGEYTGKPPPIPFHDPKWSNTPSDIAGWLDLAFTVSDWLTPDNWQDHPIRKFLREGD